MKILITGMGLLGTAISEIKTKHELIFNTRKDYDLTKPDQVYGMFFKYKPDAVIHTAAKVLGIGGNKKYSSDIFYQNLAIDNNVLHFANKFNVKKLFALSSSWAFSSDLAILRENDLHVGEPYGHFYGYAKRMIDLHIQSLQQQYGTKNYVSIICTNLFGKNDNYDLEDGRAIPSLIHKIYLAKKNNTPLHVWGDGSTTREFLFSEDAGLILLNLIENDDLPSRIILSNNQETSIKQIVEMLCEISGFRGEIIFDITKPSGSKNRPTDLTVLNSLVKCNYTKLHDALSESYKWFKEKHD